MIYGIVHSFRKIPNWLEFGIVLGAVFGWFIGGQWSSAESPDLGSGPVVFTDQLMVGLIIWETAVLFALGLFLWLRGWRKADLTLSITWRQTKAGLKLWLATILIYWVVALIVTTLVPTLRASAQNLKFKIEVSFPTIILLSIVNPIFEELATVLYLFKRMDWARPGAIIIMSASLRGMVHAYQGAFAMLMVAGIGAIFGWHYAKHRQIWPLILAHAIMDFLGFLAAGAGNGR